MRHRIVVCGLLSILGTGAFAASIFSDMSTLYEEKAFVKARVSSHDPAGSNSDWKVIQPYTTLTLADVAGPGVIDHIWCTISSQDSAHLKHLVLRMYWDGEANPSVEAPIGDFFGQGNNRYYHVDSAPLMDGSTRGLNCFFPMPFAGHATITVENQSATTTSAFYYYVDYRKNLQLPQKLMTFHAWYNQKYPADQVADYVLVHATGEGHFVGCNMSIEINTAGWWGEGDDKFYIDGEAVPSLWGTGSEDYFAGAWGFGEVFNRPYNGCPLMVSGGNRGGVWNVYRYHILDPIPFKTSLRAEIETGAWPGTNFRSPLSNNYSSVAYWYQTEPHAPFPPLPAERVSQVLSVHTNPDDPIKEGELMPVLAKSDAGITTQNQEKSASWTQLTWSNNQQQWLRLTVSGQWVDLEFLVAKADTYALSIVLTKAVDYGIAEVSINGEVRMSNIDCYYAGTVVTTGILDLGSKALPAGVNTLRIKVTGKNASATGYYLGIDYLKAK